MKNRFVWPLFVFILLCGFLWLGLGLKPREIPSTFINKTAPPFVAEELLNTEQISPQKLKGQVWIMNIWASWCVACREEHPVIIDLAQQSQIPIVGLNYKDQEGDAKQWLQRFGNPYNHIAVDDKGDIGIDYGVYGVPETFIIDKQGFIQYKHIGPITNASVKNQILPMIAKLQAIN